MQQSVQNWDVLFNTSHKTEYKYIIDGVTYTAPDIIGTPVISKPLLNVPTIGRVCSATLSFVIRQKENTIIPKAAQVKAYCRLVNDSIQTPWVPQGVFFISSRTVKTNITLNCRDAMIKSGQTYLDKTRLVFPKSQIEVLNEIADLMGVDIDPRTVIKTGSAYMVEDIADDTVMTELLGYIAACNGGNFVMTEQGKLRLIPLLTHEATVLQDIGTNYKSYITSSEPKQISRLTMVDDAKNEYTAGDDISSESYIVIFGSQLTIVNNDETKGRYDGSCLVIENAGSFDGDTLEILNETDGFEIYIKNPLANQTIVDNLIVPYQQGGLYGVRYNPGICEKMFINPLLEVGDCVSITDYKSDNRIRKFRLNAMTIYCNVGYTCTNDVGIEKESEEEYPYVTASDLTMQRVVTTDQKYYGNSISRHEGFKSKLEDGGYALFNADQIRFVNRDGSPGMYYDNLTGLFRVLGTIIAGRIQDVEGYNYWDLDNSEFHLSNSTTVGSNRRVLRDLINQIDNAVNTWYQAEDPSDDWSGSTVTEHIGDLWYRTTDNTTWRWNGTIWNRENVPDEIFDKIDGKSTIFSSQPTTPYNVGDLWVQGINGDVLKCITARSVGAYNANDWAFACKYTDDSSLINFINNDYAQDIEDLTDAIDLKIQTWYQTTDPSVNWSAAEKASHAGDIWYDSKSTSQKTYRWNGESWVEQLVPKSVLDDIDGKRTIFYGSATPQNPEERDLWVKDNQGDFYIYTNGEWVFCNDININIGGRNIVLQSNKDTSETKTHHLCADYDLAQRVISGEEYSWSAQISYTSDKQYIALCFDNENIQASRIDLTGSGSKRVAGSFIATSQMASKDTIKLYTNIPQSQTESSLEIEWIKLEKGNQVTDWTPAPEDYYDALSVLKDQVDAKIETWYQSTDPSTNWSAAEKTAHVGDLWYDTTDNTTKRWSGVTWADQDVPDEVFDRIDGKSTIYYGTSITPSDPNENDLWVKDNNGNTFIYRNNAWVFCNDLSQQIEEGTVSVATTVSDNMVRAIFDNIKGYLTNDETLDGDAVIDKLQEQLNVIQADINGVDFKFSNTYVGGFNMLLNSSGLNGVSNVWETSGTEVIAEQSGDAASNTASGSAFRLNTATLSQSVNVIPGRIYTFSFKSQNNTSNRCYVTIHNSGSDITVFDEQQQGTSWVDRNYVFKAVGELITITAGTTGQYLYVADFMLIEGGAIVNGIQTPANVRWSPAPYEIYTRDIKMDGTGLHVTNDDSPIETLINNEKFAIKYNNEEVLKVSSEITEMNETVIRGNLTIGKGKFVPRTNGLDLVLLD